MSISRVLFDITSLIEVQSISVNTRKCTILMATRFTPGKTLNLSLLHLKSTICGGILLTRESCRSSHT